MFDSIIFGFDEFFQKNKLFLFRSKRVAYMNLEFTLFEDIINLCYLFFDLIFDSKITDGAESIEFDFVFFELLQVRILRDVDFWFSIGRTIMREHADLFTYMTSNKTSFGISFKTFIFRLLHQYIIISLAWSCPPHLRLTIFLYITKKVLVLLVSNLLYIDE